MKPQRLDQPTVNADDVNWNVLCAIGGLAALLQLFLTLAIIATTSILGMRPTTAEEFFELLQNDRLIAILRDDYSSLIIIALYLFTFPGICAALRRIDAPLAVLATLLALVGSAVCIASHTGISMIHLSDAYAAAATDAERSQLLAAGEALIAMNMWNSTAGFFAGILLQGAGVLVSAVMLRSRVFSRWTAYSGIVANGLDLVQHLLAAALPQVSNVVLILAGPFYLTWFFMLGRDLLRLARRDSKGGGP